MSLLKDSDGEVPTDIPNSLERVHPLAREHALEFDTRYHNMEEFLADFFGLNDSKYQWAVDEYFKTEEEVCTDAELY
eukprot:5480260-Pyramimonas_sp.AAC.3